MVRLSDKGWSVPQFARHFKQNEQNEQTVWYWIKALLQRGFDALDDRSHTGQKSVVTPKMLAEGRVCLTKGDRTCSPKHPVSSHR